MSHGVPNFNINVSLAYNDVDPNLLVALPAPEAIDHSCYEHHYDSLDRSIDKELPIQETLFVPRSKNYSRAYPSVLRNTVRYVQLSRNEAIFN
jgi:hypothetical protein